jgi:hypothetical protein
VDKRIEILTTVLETCRVRVEAGTEEEAVSGISFFQSLPEVCPLCGERLIFTHRKPTDKAEYYGLVCLNKKEPHETNFGDSQRFPGCLYYKGDSSFKPVPGGPSQPEDKGATLRLSRETVNSSHTAGRRRKSGDAMGAAAGTPRAASAAAPPTRDVQADPSQPRLDLDSLTIPPEQIREELVRVITAVVAEISYVKLKGVRRAFDLHLLKAFVNQKYQVTDGIESLTPPDLRHVYNWLFEERERERKREAIMAEALAQKREWGEYSEEIKSKFGGRELDDLTLDELITAEEALLSEAVPF